MAGEREATQTWTVIEADGTRVEITAKHLWVENGVLCTLEFDTGERAVHWAPGAWTKTIRHFRDEGGPLYSDPDDPGNFPTGRVVSQ